MEYLNLDALNLKSGLMFFIAIGAAYFFFKATKHLLVGLFFLVAAVGAAGYLSGVITPEKVKAATDLVKEKAAGTLEGASDKAKAIGEKGYSTSAGSASETNEAFKKNLEVKKNRAPH